ncbi:hypothetical protein [Duganella qianjiadongensis]|uniref:Uncharacterized protein n=1 Tax=Duganella qianjiadongensis TaxID=2692176 RepID=A0ABW9VHY3_9BURK|nr:hypothetical protein [Duganella qianjiadongensis]MYM38153.1 hypothetical protein [Duganella qianjiadongensis]
MYISTPVVSSSTEPSNITFSSPISKKRVYDCQSNTFARNPLRNVCSKIRSAWGDLREFIGVPSEVRRLRNALPATLGPEHRAQIEKLMAHLNATGEQALHARLDKNLHILQLKERIESTNSHISDANNNLQHYAAQASKLKLEIAQLKQSRLPDEAKLPQEVLANLDRVNGKLLLAQFAPILVTADDVVAAKQYLETALAQLPSTTAFGEARELLLSVLTVVDRLMPPQADPDQVSSLAQEAIATVDAIKDLSASAHERDVHLAREIATKEAQLKSEENSLHNTSDNLQAIESCRDELQQELNEQQAVLALLPTM